MFYGLLFVLAVAVVALLFWRQNQARDRVAREREERRARADQVLARALLGDDPQPRHTIGGGAWPQEKPQASAPLPEPDLTLGQVTLVQAVDIDILLGDEPTAIAEQARQQLARPTTLLSGLAGATTQPETTASGTESPLTLLDGRIDVSLEALVIAWFAARGYVAGLAPATAKPISLLLRHREDSERSYAFFFERGRLSAQRAAAMVELAQSLGMNRLLVAAEHGSEPQVGSSRMPDVLVMDWVTLDRELKKLDFRVAAKIVAAARTWRAATK